MFCTSKIKAKNLIITCLFFKSELPLWSLMVHTVPSICITHTKLLKPIKAPSLLPQQAIIHRKGEASNLLAGWLGGQRGLSHQSTAVLNENRKWFTSLMLQPSACLPASQPLPRAASSVDYLHTGNETESTELGKRGMMARHSPKNCSNDTSSWILCTSINDLRWVLCLWICLCFDQVPIRLCQ